MKILAVDDDIVMLEILKICAVRAGFVEISSAISGELALEILRTEGVKYDCLLFDISMPGMDGIELCTHARAIPAYAKTPIIMLTAMSEKDFIHRAFAAGATDYANKPFDLIELNARLSMAAELIIARRAAEDTLSIEYAATAANINLQSVPLGYEVRIEGVYSLIEYFALRNYLSQLSVSGAICSQVLAVKVDQIQSIHARTSGEEFIYALTEVATAISAVLRNEGFMMMAYTGNGLFLIVSGKPSLEQSGKIESEIQSLLDERDIQFDNGNPLDIDISVSNPIRPSTNKLYGVKRTFERAIRRVESHSTRKGSVVRATIPNIKLRNV